VGIVLQSHKPSASAPPAETIVRTAKGTATGVGTALTKTGVSVAAGSYLFVVLGYAANQDIGFQADCMTLDDNPVFAAVEFDGTYLGELQIAGGSSAFLLYAYCASAVTNGTLRVAFIENGQGAESAPSCVILTQVAGLASSAALDRKPANSGNDTSPSSGASAATSQAHEFVIGVVGTGGPAGDSAGTWTAPLEAGQRVGVGTGAGGSAVTISDGFYIQTVAAARTAAKTGITSRYWVAGVATFKAAA
jgi:hypothetical protein